MAIWKNAIVNIDKYIIIATIHDGKIKSFKINNDDTKTYKQLIVISAFVSNNISSLTPILTVSIGVPKHENT